MQTNKSHHWSRVMRDLSTLFEEHSCGSNLSERVASVSLLASGGGDHRPVTWQANRLRIERVALTDTFELQADRVKRAKEDRTAYEHHRTLSRDSIRSATDDAPGKTSALLHETMRVTTESFKAFVMNHESTRGVVLLMSIRTFHKAMCQISVRQDRRQQSAARRGYRALML